MAVNKKNRFNLGVCKEDECNIPQAKDGFMFESNPDTTDLSELEILAFQAIWNICREDSEKDPEWYSASEIHINLYVSKITPVLRAVLHVCRHKRISVTVWGRVPTKSYYLPLNMLGSYKAGMRPGIKYRNY